MSLQAKRAESRSQWRELIKEASQAALPHGFYSTESPVAVTLFYFPSASMQGDIDNIVKPVLDALTRNVYVDDRQVERVWVQKFEPGRVFGFSNPSPVLAEALNAEKPVLYIRISEDSSEGLT